MYVLQGHKEENVKKESIVPVLYEVGEKVSVLDEDGANWSVQEITRIKYKDGSFIEYDVRNNHYRYRYNLTEVFLRKYRPVVGCIKFETNLGTVSPLFGNAAWSHEMQVEEAPSGGHLVGTRGRSSTCLEGIGFSWADQVDNKNSNKPMFKAGERIKMMFNDDEIDWTGFWGDDDERLKFSKEDEYELGEIRDGFFSTTDDSFEILWAPLTAVEETLPLRSGDRVMARWRGFSKSFSGKISNSHEDGTFDIEYDDV